MILTLILRYYVLKLAHRTKISDLRSSTVNGNALIDTVFVASSITTFFSCISTLNGTAIEGNPSLGLSVFWLVRILACPYFGLSVFWLIRILARAVLYPYGWVKWISCFWLLIRRTRIGGYIEKWKIEHTWLFRPCGDFDSVNFWSQQWRK